MIYGSHPKAGPNSGRTFSDLDLHVKDCVRAVRESELVFDSIIVTGLSGIVVGAPLALRLGVHLLVLRKVDEDTHGTPGELLGRKLIDDTSRVLFVDDFISGGATFSRCCDAITQAGGSLVASLEYYQQAGRNSSEERGVVIIPRDVKP